MLAARVLFALAVSGALAFPATVYVPDNHASIQDALAAVANGDTIIVRPGIYFENISFLGKAVILESEAGPAMTIIDGGFPQNPNEASVVIFSNGEGKGSVIDGFTITNGTGTVLWSDSEGGGVFCTDNSSPVVRNNWIVRNSADGAGGVFCSAHSNPEIRDNLISGNLARSTYGGGINVGAGVTVISGNVISDNHSPYYHGGGLVLWGADAVVDKNEISGNTCSGFGGGMEIMGGQPIVSENLIQDNQGGTGGGICATGSVAIIDGNRIVGNAASLGGGIYVNCHDTRCSIENNLIAGNRAFTTGGGIFSYGCDRVMAGNTIAGNEALITGGGVSCAYERTGLVNTILWNNTAPFGKEVDVGGYMGSAGILDLAYSTLEGGAASVYVGTGSVFNPRAGLTNADPLFVDPMAGDYRLKQDPAQPGLTSPCVDAGDPQSTPPAGTTRTDGVPDSGRIDMGYHYPLGDTIHVPVDQTTIQGAIDAAKNGDTILVAPGTYLENIDYLGKEIRIRSESGAASTVLDGGSSGSVVTFRSGENANSILKGFTVTNGSGNGQGLGGGIFCLSSSPSILDNVIRDNVASLDGGGIYCDDSSPLIKDNTIAGNSVGAWWRAGAGVYCTFSSPHIVDNDINGNIGSGILSGGGSPTIVGNVVKGNAPGLSLGSGNPLVRNNEVTSNECGVLVHSGNAGVIESNVISYNYSDSGGGLSCSSASPTIRNNMVFRNRAKEGGGFYFQQSLATLAGNTVFDNEASQGGGLFCWKSHVTIVNSIFWVNQAPTANHFYLRGQFVGSSNLNIRYSCVSNPASASYIDPGSHLYVGQGMQTVWPGFVQLLADDFHITALSSCIDAGDPAIVSGEEIDFEGDPRISGSAPDIGADEFHHHLDVTDSIPPGGYLTVRFIGNPGEPAVLGAAKWLTGVPQQTLYGTLFLKPPATVLGLGTVDQGGHLFRTFAAPLAWVSGETWFLQALIGKSLTNCESILIE